MIENMLFGGPISFMALMMLTQVAAFCPEYKQWKDRIWFKILLGIALFWGVLFLDYYLVDFDTASTTLEAPFCLVAALIYLIWAFRFPLKEAVYCTVWIYMITEFMTQVTMPLTDKLCRNFTGIVRYGVMACVYLGCILLGYILVNKYFAATLQVNEHYHVGRQKLLVSVFAAAVYMVVSNYQFIFWLLGYEPSEGSSMIGVFRLSVMLLCMVFLYAQCVIEKRQSAERELDMIQQLWYRQQSQYQMSSETIELINCKCHDMKRQMEALRKMKDQKELDEQLKEMEKSVMIYDSAMKTGNPVLDTVLTEKSLYCEEHQINMTCMADGSKLDFVGKVDLYTMFGNALDNAIESVMQQDDPEKRVIQVAVYFEKNLQMIRVRNYCEECPEFVNGLPVTSKKDQKYHGYGLKSIRHTAEKYGGSIVCRAKDHCFTLQILLPIP